MSASFEIAYTVSNFSSERPEFPASNLQEGGKWAPEPTFGPAWVDITFGTEFCIHSLSFSASGCEPVHPEDCSTGKRGRVAEAVFLYREFPNLLPFTADRGAADTTATHRAAQEWKFAGALV